MSGLSLNPRLIVLLLVLLVVLAIAANFIVGASHPGMVQHILASGPGIINHH